MNQWVARYKDVLTIFVPIVIATLSFSVGMYKHIQSQNQELEFKKFEFIILSLKQLSDKTTTVEQQAFSAHELRHHPKYYKISAKILKDLIKREGHKKTLLIEEAKESLEIIEKEI